MRNFDPQQSRGSRLALVGAVAAVLALSPSSNLAGQAAKLGKLTPAARTSVEALYPQAKIVKIGHDREGKLSFFEVGVESAGGVVNIEVAPDGTIGEIEQRIDLSQLPAAVQSALAAKTTGGKVNTIERIERRGVAGDGTFVALPTAAVLFEVGYRVGAKRHELVLDADGKPLTGAAAGDDEDGDDDDDDDDDDDGDDAAASSHVN